MPAWLLALALLAQAPQAQVPHAALPATAKGALHKAVPAKAQPAPPPPLCQGDYADALPPEKANGILDLKEQYVFAIRNTATYEHVYYGRDGKLRRQYLRSTIHGTGFAYRAASGETLIATNEHVASQADVTEDDRTVEGVPAGSKKVREQLRIVRDESDDYEPGHVPLTKVLSDPGADLAVLKAKQTLPVMPFRFGRSSALRAGNLVQVRGFPLGAFAALNTGKVLNPYMADSERGWSHADFVVDALLSSGNSGSPVFAVSCHTGERELVGIFHAGYTDAAALNAVIAIDQLREELETLKVPKRDGGSHGEITAQDRDRLVKELFAAETRSLTFPFGGRAVVAQLVDPNTLRFAVLDEDYPLTRQETMSLVDRAANGFGSLDAVSVLVDGQPFETQAASLEGDVKEHFERLYDSLWRQVLAVVDFRAVWQRGRTSADAFADGQAARARIKRHASEQKDLLGICAFEADRGNFGAARGTGLTAQDKPASQDKPAAGAPPAAAAPPVAGASLSPEVAPAAGALLDTHKP